MFYTITNEQYNSMGQLFEYNQRDYVVVLNEYGNKCDIATYSEKYGNIVITSVDKDKLDNRVVL